jgi:hypothetical protein
MRTRKVGRGLRRDLSAGEFQPLIDSFELYLLAERKSAKTVRTYVEAAQWFAAGRMRPAGRTSWDEVTGQDVQHAQVVIADRRQLHQRSAGQPTRRQLVRRLAALPDVSHYPLLTAHAHQLAGLGDICCGAHSMITSFVKRVGRCVM